MVGTNEDFALKKTIEFKLQELTELDKKIVGTSACHLVIPVSDPLAMRRISAILHQAATELDALSRRHDLGVRYMVLAIRDVVNTANRDIKDITGTSKSKKRRNLLSN